MSGIVSSEAHKPATERRTNHGRGFLIVLIAAMTVVAPLLLPMTAPGRTLSRDGDNQFPADPHFLGVLNRYCTYI